MIVNVEFNIYKDFDEDVKFEELNELVKSLVESGELEISYKGRVAPIILPIDDCGNYFVDDMFNGSFWNSVMIPCRIKTTRFIVELLDVKCPSYFSVIGIFS